MRKLIGIMGAVIALSASSVWAHCDGLDGPVVISAREALETGNVNLVLPWVQKDDEPLIREAFDSTLVVRKLNPTARHMADMYFFETLVRVHRAGEGVAYTGLKPAGRDLGPALPAADNALTSGNIDSVLALLSHHVAEGVHQHFKEAMAKKNYNKADVAAGREFVEQYVRFIHYVEGIYQAAQGAGGGHAGEGEKAGSAHRD
jgi:hypothetical protein